MYLLVSHWTCWRLRIGICCSLSGRKTQNGVSVNVFSLTGQCICYCLSGWETQKVVDLLLSHPCRPETQNCAPVNVFPLQDSDSEWWFICCCLSCNRPETQNNQNQNQNQNQLYSPSLCKHTRNLLWFLRSSWYIHTYIHIYIHI